MTAKTRIEDIKNHGYDIDFSDVFNKSLENYKKIALNAGIVFILASIILGSIIIGTIAVIWGAASITQNLADLKIYNFSGVTILAYVFVIAMISGMISPLSAGILKMAHHASNNLEFSVGTAFDYYKGSYFKELFIATMLLSFLSVGVDSLLGILEIRFIGVLFSYIISFFTFLTIPLIVFGNLKALEAIQASFIIVSKQFFVLLGLLIVAVIMTALGFIGFCIGIFFTLPFLYSTYYCIYDSIIGTGYKSELEEIGTSENY